MNSAPTPIADLVERMLADSAPATAIVAAIRALECVTLRHAAITSPSRDASRDAAKDKANARARRYRLNLKNQRLAKANDVAAESVTVTPTTVTHHVTEANGAILTSLLSSSVGKPLKEARRRENARARGTRLAPGAALSEEHRAIIVAEGIHNPEKLWAEFVDYWSDIPGQRGTKVSWTGTLRNRCREVIKRGLFNGNATGAGAHPASNQSGSATIIAGVAAATERRARERNAAGQQRPTPADDNPAKRHDPGFFGAR